MKKITLFVALATITFVAMAQTTAPCPTSFKRSNGAGGGCPIAKLTLTYAVCPTMALPIDSVYQDGVKIDATFDPGIIDCSGPHFQVTYCITSSNIAPTGFLTIYFQGAGSFDGSTCNVPSTGGPLPVNLTNFYAKRTSDLVSLSWKTELEVNAKEFILERSQGKDFIAIATIPATNQANGSSYSYKDNNEFKGISQYRLRITDLDGSFSYSEVKAVKGTSSVSDFTVFPNPSTGNAKVTVSDISEPTDVQLVDNSGRILKNVSMTNVNTIDLPNLQKGMYMIRIVNKATGESLTKKLTVVN